MTHLRDCLILPGSRSVTSVIANVHNSNHHTHFHTLAFFCYPSLYLAHMLFNFLLSSHSSVLRVLVLSAALLLSLPVRCHNSFPDSFVLPLWRLEKQQQESEHAVRQRSLQISPLLLHSLCHGFAYTICLKVLENVFKACLHVACV